MIETRRLFLREMTESDFAALRAVLSDPLAMAHYPAPLSDEKVRGWIAWNLDNYAAYGFGLWAVCLKPTGEVIGDCGVTMQRIRGRIRPEIGYHIRRDLWRRGYAKEAAAACRDYIFENTPFRTVYSYMNRANAASSATARAIGMRLVDRYEEAGEPTDVYAVTRTEWARRRVPADRTADE